WIFSRGGVGFSCKWGYPALKSRHSLAVGVPIDLGIINILAGGGAGIFYAVVNDVVIFEKCRVAVAEGDVAALVVSRGEARGVSVRSGENNPVGIRAVIGRFVRTVADVRKKDEL